MIQMYSIQRFYLKCPLERAHTLTSGQKNDQLARIAISLLNLHSLIIDPRLSAFARDHAKFCEKELPIAKYL